jgi:hypothetical protein
MKAAQASQAAAAAAEAAAVAASGGKAAGTHRLVQVVRHADVESTRAGLPIIAMEQVGCAGGACNSLLHCCVL